MADDRSERAYRKMLEGKISSEKYARELKKEVRRERRSAERRISRRARGAST